MIRVGSVCTAYVYCGVAFVLYGLTAISNFSTAFAQAPTVSVNPVTVSERNKVARVPIRLTQAASQRVTVKFATSDVTANQGSDYFGVYTVVTFQPGQVEKFVNITVLTDDEDEITEEFVARIWDPQGSSLGTASATIEIKNAAEDSFPTLSIKKTSAREDDGQIVVPVVLSKAATRAVTFSYATRQGTATRGSDYYGTSGTLTVEPGKLRVSVPITILNDTAEERTESIFVRIFNVRGVRVGDEEVSISIVDDDAINVAGEPLKLHVLNRLGFGPGRWSAGRINQLGIDEYIDEQLAPGSLPADTRRCDGCSDGKVFRAINARRQLTEVLVDFWFNHFNVDGANGAIRASLPDYENQAIRRHVFGKFEDMLLAVARSPAMLRYLDNNVNTREGYVTPSGRERGLNENYARELMELHTIGVNGGYSEDDIIDVARILTGWGLRRGVYNYYRAYHDTGSKSILNDTFVIASDEGEQEGEKLLRFLATHPRTARFVSRKLIQRFVSENPPAALVTKAAQRWTATGGNLRAVLRTIFASAEFRDPNNFGTKIKSPLHLLSSATRAMDRYSLSSAMMESYLEMLEDQGQELYKVAPPTGVPEDTRYWVSGDAMLARFANMQFLADDRRLRDGVRVADGTDAQIVDQIIRAVVPQGVSASTRRQILTQIGTLPSTATFESRKSLALSLVLSSPEFMRH